jgi:hypothetical protein
MSKAFRQFDSKQHLVLSGMSPVLMSIAKAKLAPSIIANVKIPSSIFFILNPFRFFP